MKKNKDIICFAGSILIGLFFSTWLIGKGINDGHDLFFHISRIKGLAESISSGDMLAYIHNGFYGYGYANGLFYGNLLIYPSALLHIIGLDLINCWKVYVIICNVLSALFMYICMKKITKSNGCALFTSFIYSACSYKCCDFIIRSAGGEMGAFVFSPLIIMGLYELIFGDKKKWWIFSIGFVGLINSHLLSTFLIFILCVIIICCFIDIFMKDKSRIFYLIISGIFILCLGASFIFPMIEGLIKNFMVVNLNESNIKVWTRTIPIERLFLGFPYWKSKVFIPAGIGVLFFYMLSYRIKIKEKTSLIRFSDKLTITGLIFLLCVTDFFPWEEIRILYSMQFPWRLYLVCSLLFSISSGIIVLAYLKNKNRIQIIQFLIPILIIACIPYAITSAYYRSGKAANEFDEFIVYEYNDYTIAGREYLPANADIDKLISDKDILYTNNKFDYYFNKKGLDIYVDYNNNDYKDSYIEVPLLYYYGYTAVDSNNTQLKVDKGSNDRVRVFLENSKDKIHIYYGGTKIQHISIIITLLSAIAIILYNMYIKYKEKRNI